MFYYNMPCSLNSFVCKNINKDRKFNFFLVLVVLMKSNYKRIIFLIVFLLFLTMIMSKSLKIRVTLETDRRQSLRKFFQNLNPEASEQI